MQTERCPSFTYDLRGMVRAGTIFVFTILVRTLLCYSEFVISVQVDVLHAKVLQKQSFYCPWHKDFACLNRFCNAMPVE